MLDPEGRPSQPPEPVSDPGDAAPAASETPTTETPTTETPTPETPSAGDWPAVGYWASAGSQPGGPDVPPPGAPAPPSEWPPEPPPPAWTKTYELPTARKVVSSGLQLAVASSSAIRRASIYIGLLALGAFGPAVILLLIGIGRLMSDPGTADTLASDPSLVFFEQPEIVGVLALLYVLLILGFILLLAISIDAQAIAISLLGGIASERPLRLWEAVLRARQTFWRLAGTGLLVGLASGVVSLLIALPFLRPFDTNQGITFIASMIGTLAVTPFAFAATGIVLGDVGAMEALRRSVALFRARPRIAFVVVLFTLVTAAIQTFAVGAGLDVAVRVAELLDLRLDGGVGMILPAVLVLAFIVAFGSLTFTIAAIVASPQVAGFLGLTFYSGGLDRVRAENGAKRGRFHWVTVPMAVSMVTLAVIAGAALPSIAAFEPRAASPLLAFLRTSAEAHEAFISPFGTPLIVEDPTGDLNAGAAASADILVADMAGLYEIPDWLLEDAFACDADGVACGDDGDAGSLRLDEGAIVFVQQMAAAPDRSPSRPHAEWGTMVRIPGYVGAPELAGERFEGANHRFITALDAGRLRLRQYVYEDGSWTEYFTSARSVWLDDLLITIVPLENVGTEPTAWDAYSVVREGTDQSYDNIRPADGEVIEVGLLPWISVYGLDFFDGATFAP